jgi:glyoxylase-like metal-dependent hydrolase (beta-lactamase superfamily II)
MTDKLEQITDKAWYWPPNRNPLRVEATIGAVCGNDGTLLVDAGNSPEISSQLIVAMQRRGFPPVTHIVYTHHHWDHVSGACVFNATIIAHTSCKEILLEEAKKPWGLQFLQEEIKRNPNLKVSFNARKRAIRDWETFKIIPPRIGFKRSKTLNLGNLRVELQHVGGKHAEDSIIVKVPSEGVMFLGDCYYPPPLHLRGTDISISIPMLASLVDEAYSQYIDGHSKPFTHKSLLGILRGHSD